MICYLLTLSPEYSLIYKFLEKMIIIKRPNTFNLSMFICFLLFSSHIISDKSFPPERLLSVDEAFEVSLSSLGSLLVISFKINKNSYIYADQLAITSGNNSISHEIVGESIELEDEFYGVSNIYEDDLSIYINVESLTDKKDLSLSFQGCLKNILCYPKITKRILFKRNKNKVNSFKFL